MKKIALIMVLVLFLVVRAEAEERRYLNIGADPKNLNRMLIQGEIEQVSTIDFYTEIDSGSGKIYKGWTKAGEVFVTSSISDPRCPFERCRVAKWVRRCGNDLVGETTIAGQAPIFFMEPILLVPQVALVIPPPVPVPILAPPTPAQVPTLMVVSPTSIVSKEDEMVCLGVDTTLCGISMAGLTAGIATGNPVLAVIGGITAVASCGFDVAHHYGAKESKASCKYTAGVIGGLAGGYFGFNNDSSDESSSAIGGPVNPPLGGGPVSPMP